MEPYLSAGAPSRDFQPWIGFGPTFSGARFDTAWPIAHAQLPNQGEQEFEGGVAMITQPARHLFAPQLHMVRSCVGFLRHRRLCADHKAVGTSFQLS